MRHIRNSLSLKLSLKDFFASACSDNRAVAAVEFALVLPVLVAIYLCTVEITQAISAQRKVAIASGTIGDLTAQYASMNFDNINSILRASNAVMGAFKVSEDNKLNDMSARIISVEIDSGGNPQTKWAWAWSAHNGDSDHGAYDDLSSPESSTLADSVPSDLKSPNSSVIASEVVYTYKSPFNFLSGFIDPGGQGIPIRQITYFRPRLVDSIPFGASVASTPWPLDPDAHSTPTQDAAYTGFGPEYMLIPRNVQRDGDYTKPPGDLVNAWNCGTTDPSCNPTGPGGGGYGGGGGGGCFAEPPSTEVYNIAMPTNQCYRKEYTPAKL